MFVALTEDGNHYKTERENLQQQDSVECGTSTTVTMVIVMKKHVTQCNSVAH